MFVIVQDSHVEEEKVAHVRVHQQQHKLNVEVPYFLQNACGYDTRNRCASGMIVHVTVKQASFDRQHRLTDNN